MLFCDYAGLRRRLCDPAELQFHVVHGLQTLVGIFRETGLDEVIESRRPRRMDCTNGSRLTRQDCCDGTGGSLAPEGAVTRDHFVEDSTQRKDVAASIRFLALELFGRHVLNGAEDCA